MKLEDPSSGKSSRCARPIQRLRLALLVTSALVASGLFALIAPGPATAASAGSSTPPEIQADVHMVSKPESDRAVDYWTPERMRKAEAAEAPDPSAETNWEDDTPDSDRRSIKSDPAETLASSSQWNPTNPAAQFKSDATGKIFFYDQTHKADRACSGAVIDSEKSKHVIVTAAHCVRGEYYHLNWIFVPAYKDGVHPYGSFGAFSIRTVMGWDLMTGGERASNDVAFVSTYHNRNGQAVADVVGGYDLAVASGYGYYATIFGYPANQAEGEVLHKCDGMTHADTITYPGHQFPRIDGCGFSGGASGGPWLQNYDYVTGRADVVGVTSFGPGDAQFIAAPLFDESIIELFGYAEMDG